MRVLFIFTFIVGSIFSFASDSQPFNSKIIRVVGENLPPVTFPDGTGQQFETVKEIFRHEGYDLTFEVFPYRRALAMIESGEADLMIGMLKDDNENMLYSKYPHDVDVLLAIFKENRPKPFNGIKNLQGQNITVLAGLSDVFKKQLPTVEFLITEVKTRQQAIRKIKHNRADFMIDSEGSYLLSKQMEITNGLATKPIGHIEIHAAFTNTKLGKDIKTLWDDKYLNFITSPAAKKIYQKWKLEREYKVTRNYFDQRF